MIRLFHLSEISDPPGLKHILAFHDEKKVVLSFIPDALLSSKQLDFFEIFIRYKDMQIFRI